MGTETEYGISVPGSRLPTPGHLSQVVKRYQAATSAGRAGRGGLRGGEPAARRRGLTPDPRAADSSSSATRSRAGQRILQKRRKALSDHASPRILTPNAHPARGRDREKAVVKGWMGRAAVKAATVPERAPKFSCTKNNTDNKGASYAATRELRICARQAVRDNRAQPSPRSSLPGRCMRRREGGQGADEERGLQISNGRLIFFEVRSPGDTLKRRSSTPGTSRTPTIRRKEVPPPALIIGDANMSGRSALTSSSGTTAGAGMIEGEVLGTVDLALEESPVALRLRPFYHDPNLPPPWLALAGRQAG